MSGLCDYELIKPKFLTIQDDIRADSSDSNLGFQ
jgi:hypothetical protein